MEIERLRQIKVHANAIAVSHGTQHRMVHRQHFPLLEANTKVSEMSIDGVAE